MLCEKEVAMLKEVVQVGGEVDSDVDLISSVHTRDVSPCVGLLSVRVDTRYRCCADDE